MTRHGRCRKRQGSWRCSWIGFHHWVLNLELEAQVIDLPLEYRPEIPCIHKTVSGILPSPISGDEIVRVKSFTGRNVRRRETEHGDHPVKLFGVACGECCHAKLAVNGD